MSQSQRRFLRRLRDAGVGGLPASAIPTGCARILADLVTCGAAESRPAGRGTVVYVTSVTAFNSFVQSRYPLGLDGGAEEVIDRVTGVRLLGDAKAARRGRWEGVFVRSRTPGAQLISEAGNILPVADLTMISGGAAILLGGARRWSFRGIVAVIENAEAFWQHEQELADVDLAVFACGRLSERVLEWLASDEMAESLYVHWGDYDPVGCLEYLRIKGRCGDRVRMHVPERVEDLLPAHGKRLLISQQLKALDALRRLDHDDTVAGLLRLFDQHRKGLEQEALLMIPPSPMQHRRRLAAGS